MSVSSLSSKTDEQCLELKKAIKKADRGHNLGLIERAYEFAKKAHEGQFRLSGQPYITHPVGVALILLELGMDTNSIVAGLLHDVVEDTKISSAVLEAEFGVSIAAIVEGLTKLKTVIKRGSDSEGSKGVESVQMQHSQIENIRKMLLATAKDVRVIIVRLADRLHNMRTASGWVEKKRREKALETMEIYAPLAQRLGMTVVKEELQDLAIKILDPIAYDEISKMLKFKQQKIRKKNLKGRTYIEHLETSAFEALKSMVPDVKISGRVKSHYALYLKIYINGKEWDEVFDIYAIRIVVNSILECYAVLGAMHKLFKPLHNRFKDYIATPKANFYQSLHTTVMDEFGVPFEIQIRTKQMQYMAEYGIAAHWKYKQKIENASKLEEKLSWVRRIIEMQQESENVDDFFHLFKADLSSEEVFVFTPSGEVKILPVSSTVVDFAYLIGANVGNRMIGAKINGKLASIETKVESNQVIEIITTNSKNYGPKRSWLGVAKTSVARNKIRAWFKKERRCENVARGRNEIKNEFLRNGIELKKMELPVFVEKIANFQGVGSVDDFYAAVGYGAINVSKIMNKIKQSYFEFRKIDFKSNENVISSIKISNKFSQVFVDGVGMCSFKLAKCCNPIPGCKIVGYITKSKTISVHCLGCSNVSHIQKNVSRQNRFIVMHFDEDLKQTYCSNLKIIMQNEGNVIGTITSKLINLKVKIKNFSADFVDEGSVQIRLSILVFCVSQLKNVVSALKKLRGVSSVVIATKF